MNPPDTFLSVQLNKLVDLMRIKAEIILKEKFNIEYSQFLILHFIDIIDQPNQQDISRYMGYTGAGISKQIDKLELSGMITKIMDKSNRRSNLINLTSQGQKVIDEALPLLESEFDKYIDPQDKKSMLKMTGQVITNIK
jgi:DNA-binding MarR family transcriptional regulator